MDTTRQHVVFERGEPAEFREYWKLNYGPTISVYRFNEQDPDRVAGLDQAFVDFLAGWNREGRYEAEYLMIAARTSE